MPRIVSSIKKHITTLEFWRALSFVLKRLESIAKYLANLPLPFTFILYILDLFRAGLRIFSYFKKTKNKNLGSTCKFLLALFKVSTAMIALIFLACGFISLPSVLLAAFFAYRILKLIHSAIVLIISTIFYLKIDKQCIEQQWKRAQYLNNMNKHVWMLSMGPFFMLLTYLLNAGVSILIWSNPLLLLADAMLVLVLIAAVFYLGYKIVKNKRTSGENSLLRKDEIATIKNFFLLFGLAIVALFCAVITPSLGISAIIFALILLCIQDVLLTVYYYFFDVYVPDPEPKNLDSAQFDIVIDRTNRDYYQNFSPIYYLQTQVSEKFPHVNEVIKANKELLLKATLLKILQLRNKRIKIAKSGCISRFFSSERKIKVKEDCLLLELAWALNTDNLEVLIELILSTSNFLVNNRAEISDPELQEILGHLVCLAEQEKRVQRVEIVKPKAFYHSFLKKIGDCQVLSMTCQASRKIEQDLNQSNQTLGYGG